MDTARLEVPLSEALIRELLPFWQVIFGTAEAGLDRVLAGAECTHNRDIIYLTRRGQRLAGTSHLTIGRATPTVGGLGEVATAVEFRGKGIATRLCAQACDEFRSGGGQALFLGTGNPAAARIYHRLGWRKLAGANVMVHITSGESPEAFLVDYFRNGDHATVAAGGAADRIPMIPLIVSPHDWQVLDMNVALFSTRYVVQRSCMGLYPRYAALSENGRGAWFAARTRSSRLVGLSTVQLGSADRCQVDAFTHRNYSGVWDRLMQAALRWGAARGAAICTTVVSVEDEEKWALFGALGFRQVGHGDPFDLDGRSVASVRLERASPCSAP